MKINRRLILSILLLLVLLSCVFLICCGEATGDADREGKKKDAPTPETRAVETTGEPATETEPEPVTETAPETESETEPAPETEPDTTVEETGGYIDLGFGYPETEAEVTWQETESPETEAVAAPKGVPVLMYHAISDDIYDILDLFVSPSNMEEQLQYLCNNGYTPIFFSELERAGEFDKPIILTYDDGYEDIYTSLFPLLKKYNVKVTLFIIGNGIGKAHKMTAEQIREMYDSGLADVQSHTMYHPYLGNMSYQENVDELVQSRNVIENLVGKRPDVICYPSGSYSQVTLDAARDYYKYGVSMNEGRYHTGDDPYTILRHGISHWCSIYDFASIVAEY